MKTMSVPVSTKASNITIVAVSTGYLLGKTTLSAPKVCMLLL